MRPSIFQIKLCHSAVFVILSAAVLYVFYSGIVGPITKWTWLALGLALGEGVVLALSGWRCPLTRLAEKLGAEHGAVSDIFLPKWFADRVFWICGFSLAAGCALVLVRWQGGS